MEIIKEPRSGILQDTDLSGVSVNIDHLPDTKHQKVNLQTVVEKAQRQGETIDLDQLVIDENGYVQTVKRELKVSIDHETGNTVISVIDGNSHNIVRNIPQNEILAVEQLITAPAGMLFRAQA